MLTKRKVLALIAALAVGASVYYSFGILLAWLVLDVLHVSVSTADVQGLIWMIVMRLIPLCCAMLMAMWVSARLWRGSQS